MKNSSKIILLNILLGWQIFRIFVDDNITNSIQYCYCIVTMFTKTLNWSYSIFYRRWSLSSSLVVFLNVQILYQKARYTIKYYITRYNICRMLLLWYWMFWNSMGFSCWNFRLSTYIMMHRLSIYRRKYTRQTCEQLDIILYYTIFFVGYDLWLMTLSSKPNMVVRLIYISKNQMRFVIIIYKIKFTCIGIL